MENIGLGLTFLVAIVLIVLGVRTKSQLGRWLVMLGVLVIVGSLLNNWNEVVQGFKDGAAGN